MPLAPPVGPDGQVVPHDDPAILPQSMLIRHINVAVHVVPDENLQGRRISSAAFSPTSGDPHYGMSVDLGQLLAEQGLPENHMVRNGMGAVKLRTGDVRAEGLRVGSDPVPTNAFHGQVWGVRNRKRLHRLVVDWVVPISGVAIRG